MKHTKLAGLSTLGTFAVSALFASAAIQAQESGSRSLEEIVVTAAYREQGLQDVPVSISAVTGDTMAQTAERLRDITDQTKLPFNPMSARVVQAKICAQRFIESNGNVLIFGIGC